jgi:hypothetical protein
VTAPGSGIEPQTSRMLAEHTYQYTKRDMDFKVSNGIYKYVVEIWCVASRSPVCHSQREMQRCLKPQFNEIILKYQLVGKWLASSLTMREFSGSNPDRHQFLN